MCVTNKSHTHEANPGVLRSRILEGLPDLSSLRAIEALWYMVFNRAQVAKNSARLRALLRQFQLRS